jgi:Uma2 family endonuclease
MLKVSQYLQGGVQAVWLLYPGTQLAYRYLPGKLQPEVRSARAGDKFEEPELLSGFSLSLSEILK